MIATARTTEYALACMRISTCGLVVISVAPFLIGIWLALDLEPLESLVAASMAIGIGQVSILLTVPAIVVVVLLACVYSLIGPLFGSTEFAPARYKSLVAWFPKNRMYQ